MGIMPTFHLFHLYIYLCFTCLSCGGLDLPAASCKMPRGLTVFILTSMWARQTKPFRPAVVEDGDHNIHIL